MINNRKVICLFKFSSLVRVLRFSIADFYHKTAIENRKPDSSTLILQNRTLCG